MMDLMWPSGYSNENLRYSTAAMQRADERFPERMHCFKVIDTDLPDSDPFDKVVGVSHWKIFPRERSEEEVQKEKELNDKDDELYPDPPSLNQAAVGDWGDCTKGFKDKHVGRKPYMLLHVIGTRAGHARRGVGAISMKWGTDKADELGLQLYLEGSPKGVGLYKRWGFEVVDTLPFDARKHGYPDSLTHVCMLRPPKSEL